MAWLGTQPLVVWSAHVNGSWTLTVQTPCNVLNVEVAVTETVLAPGRIIQSAMGCLGPEGGYESWTHKLFEQPVIWNLDGQSLTLSNAHATINLKES